MRQRPAVLGALTGAALHAPVDGQEPEEQADHLGGDGQIGGKPDGGTEAFEGDPVLLVGGLGVPRPAVRGQTSGHLDQALELRVPSGHDA